VSLFGALDASLVLRFPSMMLRRLGPTSDTSSRPNIHLNRSFLRHFISAQHFDWSVDGADDGVAIVCVGGRPIGAVQMRESDFWDDHCVLLCVAGWWLCSRVHIGCAIEPGQKFGGAAKASIRLRLKLSCRGAPSTILAWGQAVGVYPAIAIYSKDRHTWLYTLGPVAHAFHRCSLHSRRHYGRKFPQCIAHEAAHD
jgi:hypothetical protein